MLIEILRFQVQPGQSAEFVRRNAAVWTPVLQQQSGFLRQETLVSQHDPHVIVVLVYWRSAPDLAAFPGERAQQLDEQLADIVVQRDVTLYTLVDRTGTAG